MAAQVLPIEYVISDPEVRGGQPILAGTSLRVSDLAAYHVLAGLTPEQLASQFHKAAVDAEIRSNSDQAEIWRQRLIAQGRAINV
jgi:uncharacterized protein (DUF433 family)